jgi:hypothetical protein
MIELGRSSIQLLGLQKPRGLKPEELHYILPPDGEMSIKTGCFTEEIIEKKSCFFKIFLYNEPTMKKMTLLAIFLVTGLLIVNVSFADQGAKKQAETIPAAEAQVGEKTLEAIEFLTGFSWGDLRHRDDYHFRPVIVDFDLDLKQLTKKIKFNPRSLVQFQIEPFLGYISSPDSNFEMGTSFFFKFGLLPQTSKIQPYIKAGVGLDYMTLHTNEQSTQFNFISTGAVGTHIFFKENVALTLEGRYRHLSNASIDEPNTGINTYWGTVGILYQF